MYTFLAVKPKCFPIWTLLLILPFVPPSIHPSAPNVLMLYTGSNKRM